MLYQSLMELSKWRISLNNDAKLLASCNSVMFHIHGMYFELIHHRLYLSYCQKFFNVMRKEVGDTDKFDSAFLYIFLKCSP